MPLTDENIPTFRQKAKAAGFSDTDIEKAISQWQASKLATEYKMPVKEIEKDPERISLQYQQVKSTGYQPTIEPLAVEAQKTKGLVESGLRALETVKSEYQKDPNVLNKQLIPGKFASRTYDSAAYNAADTLLRLRTGAQANPSEIRGYMGKLMPSFGDSPESAQYKLNQITQDLMSYDPTQKKTTQSAAPNLDGNPTTTPQSKPDLMSKAKQVLDLTLLYPKMQTELMKAVVPKTTKYLEETPSASELPSFQQANSQKKTLLGLANFMLQRAKEDFNPKGLEAAGELASWAVPAGRGVKGLAATGAATGAIRGATGQADNLTERAKNTATEATLGGAIGGALAIPGAIVSKVTTPEQITKVLKPVSRDIKNLRRYHHVNFGEAMIDDVGNLVGKSEDEMSQYLLEQQNNVVGLTKDHLDQGGRNIPKKEVQAIVDRAMKEAKAPGKVFQGAAIAKLDELQTAVKQLPASIPAFTLDNAKRSTQVQARSVYNTFGQASAEGESLEGIAAQFNNLIEKYNPGTKALNTRWAVLEAAKNGLESKMAQGARAGMSPSSKIASSAITSGIGVLPFNPQAAIPMTAAGAAVGAVKAINESPGIRLRAAQLGQKKMSEPMRQLLAKLLLQSGLRGYEAVK